MILASPAIAPPEDFAPFFFLTGKVRYYRDLFDRHSKLLLSLFVLNLGQYQIFRLTWEIFSHEIGDPSVRS